MPIVSEDLRRALQDPGYTPPRRAFAEMFALLSHPELAERAERALLSAGLPAATYAAEHLLSEPAAEPASVRLIGRAARAHDAPLLLEALSRALQSPHPETQRQAAIALGKSGRPAAEALLLPSLQSGDAKLLRSVIEALGKVGGQAALARLRELEPPSNLRQVVERARIMLERNVGRAAGVVEPIACDSPLPKTATIVLECRAGLSEYLAEEASRFGARVLSRSEVMLEYAGPLRPLLELRLALGVAICWPLEQGTSPGGVLGALLDPELARVLSGWSSSSQLRFRLEWAGAGHRRADTWRVAQGLREAGSPLLNDPSQAPWTIEVRQDPARLLLKPTAAPELRFDYRVRDVPAASHPTIAAALARFAGAQPEDVVWDPFAGSGVELIERARLGPYRELHGTDLDARALAAARENADQAGLLGLNLQQADARTHRVAGLSLVLTNPPMGRRVLRARGLSGVLCQVVRNVAAQLAPRGRMVWLSPFPDATARAASDAGLKAERITEVDLGGFAVELQRFERV
jgi:hypothetical protein